MEYMLTKNIFRDSQLNKLSPDYNPADVVLRMQERRAMFKDIHNHGTMNSNHNRNSIKKGKDEYKITKEIVKLRNDFHNMNLRNQIMVKRYIRNSDPKTELHYNCELLLNDIKVLHDDTDECIKDIDEDMNKLVVYNDTEFKLNHKHKLDKTVPEIRKNQINTGLLNQIDSVNVSDDHSTDNTIRVECTLQERESNNSYDTECNYEHSLPAIVEKVDVKINTPLNNPDVNDLQTLLIMMAISKSNIQNEPEVCSPQQKKTLLSIENEVNFKVQSSPRSPNKGVVDVGDILNIKPLRTEKRYREMYLARKFFEKWKSNATKTKEVMGKQRQATLNKFFDNLSRKKLDAKHCNDSVNKAKVLVRDYDTYEHRYKVQKHIIALQKAKLEEQNRLIEELKYNRIVEASRYSVDAMKEVVRKTYYEIDRQLKPKIKCLTNELKLHEIEEPSLVLHCLKMPRFLQRMEKRAREREEKHAVIRERRRQIEEERIRMKQQAEIAKAEMDKEEKMKRIQELREKRRKEKIETIRKKQYAARLRSLIVMADLHYEKSLTSKYGIRPFKMLLQIKRDNIEKAKLHYKIHLKMNVFLNWMWYTEDMIYERNYIAEEFYRKKIMKKVFCGLKRNVHSYTLKKQVAADYYDLYVTQLVFRKFREAVNIVKKDNEAKWSNAVKYYNSNLAFKILTCWRTLPALMALKREQEARKARWREKVLTVVPDYMPPDE